VPARRAAHGTQAVSILPIASLVSTMTRSTSVWLIAIHRLFEVSLGIAVGLVLSALWPERQSGNLHHQTKTNP
jgi:membrane-bound metal-dependent hydrolase YbcI (DUF457 family)